MTGSASWISGYLGVVAVGSVSGSAVFLRLGDERLDFEVRWRLPCDLFGGSAMRLRLDGARLN